MHAVVAAATAAKSLQSCPTLCDPINSSPPGSPVPGILQARTLEWVAISFCMHSWGKLGTRYIKTKNPLLLLKCQEQKQVLHMLLAHNNTKGSRANT